MLLPKLQSYQFAIAALVCFAWVSPLLAQQDSRGSQNGLQVSVNSQFAYDDNLLRQQTEKIGSRMWEFNPRARYQLQLGGGTYYINYDLNHLNYLDSSQDTVTNHALTFGIEEKLNSSNKFSVDGNYNRSFEGRGVGTNEAANALELEKPTLIQVTDISAKYQLGQDGRGARIIASVGRRFNNRNSPLIINDSRDTEEDFYSLQMNYRVASRTDLVAELRHHEVSYPRTPVGNDGRAVPLDSAENQYLIGAELEATAKTTGKLRVGTSSREFKWKGAQWRDADTGQNPPVEQTAAPATVAANAFQPSDSGNTLFWEFAAVWSPRSYSRFELSTRTSTHESLGVGSYVRSKDLGFIWTHQWNNRMRTRLDFTIGTDEYQDTSRVDDRESYNVRMEYDFSKQLNLGFGYTRQTLESTFARADFSKSIYYIFANYRNR